MNEPGRPPADVPRRGVWPSEMPRFFEQTTPTWRRPIRVLMADDHSLIRRALGHVLSFEDGFQVAGEATDGQQAVERARELLPDLVIMDVAMPGLDGIEATRRIARELPNVRVLGLSVEVEATTNRAMRAAGADALLTKGVANEALIAACHRVVGR